MSRIAKRSAVTLLVALLGVGFAPPVSLGQGSPSPLVPPQSNAFGKSFEEWNVLQTQFATEVGLGAGPTPSDTVGRVRLFPAEFFVTPREFDITLPPGTPFVASPIFVIGERYDDPNMPDDDPILLAEFLEEKIFATVKILTVLDGQVLLEGTGTELARFRFGPVFFDEPIVYASPQPRPTPDLPGLNAIAALWVTGIGSVYRPLPVGEHTLVYDVRDFIVAVNKDFQITYHITVSPN
jgi:hypothetical protein